MRRLLKLRTWGLRGTTAAETSLVLVAATLIVPALLFAGASWLAYDETRRQAEERIARAFEPFFTTKQRGQGTGLGFSMTFGYVKQVGGHLKICSEIGRGTMVKIYMPRAVDEAREGPEPVREPLPATDGSLVMLVVEDDPMVREFAISACREIGCTVYHAGDGAQALAVLEAHDDIGLLFTDVGLPGNMNGRRLAVVATGRRPGLKVLFTTGYTANAIVHHGVLDPGVNFIGKPFTIPALGAKIKSLGF